jgi:hypothetical protein
MALETTQAAVNQRIETLDATAWDGPVSAADSARALAALEAGKVVFLPGLSFALSNSEQLFLDPSAVTEGSKNVAYNPTDDTLKHNAAPDEEAMRSMMRRFYTSARALVAGLAPRYAEAFRAGRTSFRPVEIAGRPASRRQDDTLLHVDAFPTTPVGRSRILRVFCNVNPHGKTRDWRLGAPFADIAARFAPTLPAPLPGVDWLREKVGLTRGRRTAYDHMMLALHDAMKEDAAFQHQVSQIDYRFPAGSTWIVFTDQAAHAATGGQHLFEQTFYVPVEAMAEPGRSPLRVLENLRGHALV